jgi:putative hydrolase of the HAD superfamily
MNSKYKALLVDLDDTLTVSQAQYAAAQKFTATYVARKYSLDLDQFYQLVKEKRLIVARNFPSVHTRHSRILIYRMAMDEMIGKYDLSLLPDLEDMFWEHFLNNIEVFPGVKVVLKKIRDSGVKIAIVSDGSLSLRIRKIKAAGLLHLVDEVVASEEVIFEKPFSAIFTLALSRLSVESHEAIMLGNNYKNDIRGAQLIGLRSGIFNPPENGHVEGQDGTIEADFEINEYDELLPEFGIVKNG